VTRKVCCRAGRAEGSQVREAEEREAQEIAAREAEQAETEALLADPAQRDSAAGR
jgi:hypothetical protein